MVAGSSRRASSCMKVDGQPSDTAEKVAAWKHPSETQTSVSGAAARAFDSILLCISPPRGRALLHNNQKNLRV